MPRSLYEVIGVDAAATTEEIRRAYRRKALQLHPDRLLHKPHARDPDDTDECSFAALQHAYEVLSDERLRARHDIDHFSAFTNETVTSVNDTDCVSSMLRGTGRRRDDVSQPFVMQDEVDAVWNSMFRFTRAGGVQRRPPVASRCSSRQDSKSTVCRVSPRSLRRSSLPKNVPGDGQSAWAPAGFHRDVWTRPSTTAMAQRQLAQRQALVQPSTHNTTLLPNDTKSGRGFTTTTSRPETRSRKDVLQRRDGAFGGVFAKTLQTFFADSAGLPPLTGQRPPSQASFTCSRGAGGLLDLCS